MCTKYIRFSIKLLNYINNEGATYKQYNANTFFLDLKKIIVLGVVKYLLSLTTALCLTGGEFASQAEYRGSIATDMSRKNR